MIEKLKMPGYEAILVDLRDDRTETFRCRDCKLLLRDPVQVLNETGWHYCQACIPAGWVSNVAL